jgi:chitin-binding protein
MEVSKQGSFTRNIMIILGIGVAGFAAQPVIAAAQPEIDAHQVAAPLDWAKWKFLGGLDPWAPVKEGDVVTVRFYSLSNAELHSYSVTVGKPEGNNTFPRWAQQLLELVSKADIGIVSGNPDPRWGKLRDNWGTATRYFYGIVPGTFSRATTDIHHADGRVTVQPEDDTKSMLFEAPSVIGKGEDFTYRVGASGGTETRWAIVGIFDAGTGERLELSEPLTGPGYAPRYTFRVGEHVVGPLKMIATVNISTGGDREKNYMKVHTIPLRDSVAYTYVFPDGLASYDAGVNVLQPRDGNIYECKPFPYSGYCRQWSASAIQYEPGIGSDWQNAWILKP